MDEIVPIRIEFGEEKSWEEFCIMLPEKVCREAGVRYDPKGFYVIRCFGMDFNVYPCENRITGEDAGSDFFLKKLSDFFRLDILWYMTSAMDIPCTGKLMRPVDVRGGHRFAAGTHVLPLDKIAERFAKDPEGFIAQGKKFGAEVSEGFGDAAVKLYPLPRVPVLMVLWLEDSEDGEDYPPRVDLLFDSTCDFQISLSDIVWAVATMCCLAMLKE